MAYSSVPLCGDRLSISIGYFKSFHQKQLVTKNLNYIKSPDLMLVAGICYHVLPPNSVFPFEWLIICLYVEVQLYAILKEFILLPFLTICFHLYSIFLIILFKHILYYMMTIFTQRITEYYPVLFFIRPVLIICNF